MTPANSPGVPVQSFPLFLTQLLLLLSERKKSSYTQLCQGCVTLTVAAWGGSPALPLSSHLQPLGALRAFVPFRVVPFSARIWVYNLLTPHWVPSACAGMFNKALVWLQHSRREHSNPLTSLEGSFCNDSFRARECYKLRQEFVAQVCEYFFIVS